MIYLTTAALAAIYGGFAARRKGGNRYDIAQYVAVWAIIGGLAGLLATVILDRAF